MTKAVGDPQRRVEQLSEEQLQAKRTGSIFVSESDLTLDAGKVMLAASIVARSESYYSRASDLCMRAAYPSRNSSCYLGYLAHL